MLRFLQGYVSFQSVPETRRIVKTAPYFEELKPEAVFLGKLVGFTSAAVAMDEYQAEDEVGLLHENGYCMYLSSPENS